MSGTTAQFGKWRSRLWPVHSHEYKKLLPMMGMVFLILFVYTVARDMKDTLLVNFCSPSAIPYMKVFGTLPGAFLFMVLYSKMSNILTRPKLFYASIIPFLIFFGSFALFLYPNLEALQPVALVTWLENTLPANLQFIASMCRYWSIPVFYVASELWGSAGLSLLFWGFANQITKVTEAKRVYPFFGAFGNLALIVSGPLIMYFSKVGSSTLSDFEAYRVSLNYMMGMIVVSGVIIMGLYWFMNAKVLTDPRFALSDGVMGAKKKKAKMKLSESFAYLARSKYLLLITVLVVAYGIAINCIEVTWKGQLHLQFPNKTDYNHFMGMFSLTTGILTIFTMLFVSGNILRRFGWTTTAIITPIVLGITGSLFFGFILFKDHLTGFIGLMGTTPLVMAVIFGMVQNVMTKSCKYAMFDPTKEMAYIPLDDEQKTKGKAAIDVAGARFGKSGGAFIQVFLIPLIGFAAMTPVIAGIVLAIAVVWFLCAKALGVRFDALMAEKEQEKVEPVAIEAKGETAEPAAT